MENQYQTTLIPSDFEGNINNPFDCIGSRSFSRAVGWGLQLNWGAMCNYMIDEDGFEISYGSYIDDEPVNMMYDTKVGDTITFKKL